MKNKCVYRCGHSHVCVFSPLLHIVMNPQGPSGELRWGSVRLNCTRENLTSSNAISPPLSLFHLVLPPASLAPSPTLSAQSFAVYLYRSFTNQLHQSLMFCLLIGCSNEVLQVNSTDHYPSVCVFVCVCVCILLISASVPVHVDEK